MEGSGFFVQIMANPVFPPKFPNHNDPDPEHYFLQFHPVEQVLKIEVIKFYNFLIFLQKLLRHAMFPSIFVLEEYAKCIFSVC